VVAGGNTEGARWRRPIPAALQAIVVFTALTACVRSLPATSPTGGLTSGKDVGVLLFGDYLVPFELLSLLLLAAVFGALLLARKDRPE
jgi:NADH-quinone oxidoreductase subunit J